MADMNDKERVLQKYPNAYARVAAGEDEWIISDGTFLTFLGCGFTVSEAWANAARNLESNNDVPVVPPTKEVNMKTEDEIQAKGLTAPRVTPADIEANIDMEHYFTAGQGCDRAGVPHHPSLDQLTFCVLALKNGYTVTGQSACASPENFDAELGKKIAREDAVKKIWPLMGYALRERLSQK